MKIKTFQLPYARGGGQSLRAVVREFVDDKNLLTSNDSSGRYYRRRVANIPSLVRIKPTEEERNRYDGHLLVSKIDYRDIVSEATVANSKKLHTDIDLVLDEFGPPTRYFKQLSDATGLKQVSELFMSEVFHGVVEDIDEDDVTVVFESEDGVICHHYPRERFTDDTLPRIGERVTALGLLLPTCDFRGVELSEPEEGSSVKAKKSRVDRAHVTPRVIG